MCITVTDTIGNSASKHSISSIPTPLVRQYVCRPQLIGVVCGCMAGVPMTRKAQSVHQLGLKANVRANVFFNPRHACARVTVLVLCVCLCVYPSVPTQRPLKPANNDTHGFLLGFSELELTVSRFRALSGPTKGSNDLKDDCLVECCFRD